MRVYRIIKLHHVDCKILYTILYKACILKDDSSKIAYNLRLYINKEIEYT